MDKTDTRIKYSNTDNQSIESGLPLGLYPLCHRRDYHEDGSYSDFYYIEIELEDFIRLGGKFITEGEDD